MSMPLRTRLSICRYDAPKSRPEFVYKADLVKESAGQGTRDNAAATPWTGEESVHDVSLRMLDSSKKPMRTPSKPPQLGPVDFRFSRKPPKSPGLRIAGAKDTTAKYELSRSEGLSDKERESMRQEMRDRFSPGSRPMPASVDSLASLANERIEDAMARGQFNKIKRGKGVNVETDPNANSAYIDTTEYFMNKIIQSQEVVPPWIEKQQELKREVDRFRERLRVDWRRHAARLISSQGGPLEAQIRRAKGYAAAEARLADRSKVEASLRENGEGISTDEGTSGSSPETESQLGPEDNKDIPHLPPLRDEHYLSIDRSYHELAVKNLNALARTYNLQAPQLAQKPYISLDRELAACFADVAPSLAEEIKRRATEKAPSSASTVAEKTSTVLGSLGTSQKVRVYDEDKTKGYGFREFFNDLFSRK